MSDGRGRGGAQMPKKIAQGILIGILAASASLAAASAGLLEWLEGPSWDWRVRAAARPGPATDQVRLILIDQKSLDWAEETNRLSWPWPREIYATLLSFCRRSGAKAVAFDLVFSEPSKWGVEDDEAFGQAIEQTGGVAAALFLSRAQGSALEWPPGVPEQPFRVAGLDEFLAGPKGKALALEKAAFPVPEVASRAAVLANVSGGLDADAVVRRVFPFRFFAGRFVPSLGLAPFLAAHPGVLVELEDRRLRVGALSIPLDENGSAILRYRGPTQTHRAVNAAAVIQSELRLAEGQGPLVDPAFFRDRYVFVGTTAPGLLDLKPTPVGSVYPGVEIHATLLDNLLSGDFLRETGRGFKVLTVLFCGLVAAVFGRLCRTGLQSGLAFVLVLPLPVLAGLAGYRAGFWVEVAAPEAASVLSLVAAMVVNYATEGRQRRFLKNAFRHYLSPAVIDRLMREPGKLTLGGETRELTILFSDIQGFTGISEKLGPEQLTAFLNAYLTAMTDIILEEGGTLDKYEGDAIIAFWNAPLEQPDHAVRAVRAALRCRSKLAQMRPDLEERFGVSVHARIGINTGPVVVGNLGSEQRFDYTFIGDAGNVASRLEGINKQFGTEILLSEATFARLGGSFPAREISRVRVVGRNEPVRVFEPLLPEERNRLQTVIDRFARGLEMYYGGRFSEAFGVFSEIAGEDAPARIYARRCMDLTLNPPEAWDGVWRMTEK